MQKKRPFVMSIAGYDPSGGAGLLADSKTFEQLKVQGLGVCTAMTIQTASECVSLAWQPLENMLSTIAILMKNYPVEAVKIGVVKDAVCLGEIIKVIREYTPEAKIVWDPVLKSSSEFSFFDLNTIRDLKNGMEQINLITPNYHEYTILCDHNLFEDAAISGSVLVKGGHRESKIGTDILMLKGKKITIEPSDTSAVYYAKHGSGCVLSSAIVAYLAKGEDWENACRKGKVYIEKFLTSNPTLLGYHSN